MISNKLIPIIRRTIYKLLEREYTGKIIGDDWKDCGKNRFLNDDD